MVSIRARDLPNSTSIRMTDLLTALRSLVRVFPTAAILASALATAGEPPLTSNPWWPTAAGKATDVVILRDGTVQKGTLKSCVASQCQLGANSYPKDSIEWIGLVVGITRPPEVVNLDKDEAHLRDGTVHKGVLVGVSSTEVVLDEGAYQRRDVVWIHLAVGPRPTPQGAEPGEEAVTGPPASSSAISTTEKPATAPTTAPATAPATTTRWEPEREAVVRARRPLVRTDSHSSAADQRRHHDPRFHRLQDRRSCASAGVRPPASPIGHGKTLRHARASGARRNRSPD